ncbi:septum formation protein Maf [Thiospirochaeta perfilievii]|uniref:dTTP/UTP pyrophosphatase n=1 Tax=Thiospirochaeta perfilievii TaxID=252967 RepID=A0A5C1QIX7_9SPIO|nr:nucleoside triphosphate pyrophosphatase [Thiospirochaeta perfilievii]QEN06132.1 septum formation protein Maf [Thiospirochaeta perfilievii]
MGLVTLGSKSPRRYELLKKLGVDIVVKPPNIEEICDENLSVQENAIKITLDKLNSVRENNPNDEIILTADTFITLDNKIYGKPKNRVEAFNMITKFSGKTHQVLTGVAIYSKELDKTVTELDITSVKFKNLDKKTVDYYLNFNEWQDAAGAYQIQNMGEILIDYINGSYSSVMGLPISRIYGMFVSLNFINPVI